VWDLGDPDKEPCVLPGPIVEGKRSTWAELSARHGDPRELLVQKQRLILFESNGVYLWSSETLEPVGSVSHQDPDLPDQNLDFMCIGYRFATWQREQSKLLNVWTLDGELEAVLKAEHAVVMVDVVRVTWEDVRELEHFVLAVMDEGALIRLWDSAGFVQVCTFGAGCADPFDLMITQDFLATVEVNDQSTAVDLNFWKLSLNGRCGAEVSGTDGLLRLTAGNDDLPAPRPRLLAPFRRLRNVDFDTYFVSYRNYFIFSSVHRSGHESVHVFRSSSLTKKLNFKPAKLTKFDEWIAVQVENDGTMTVYDFRPDGVAFADIPADVSPASPDLGRLVEAYQKEPEQFQSLPESATGHRVTELKALRDRLEAQLCGVEKELSRLLTP